MLEDLAYGADVKNDSDKGQKIVDALMAVYHRLDKIDLGD